MMGRLLMIFLGFSYALAAFANTPDPLTITIQTSGILINNSATTHEELPQKITDYFHQSHASENAPITIIIHTSNNTPPNTLFYTINKIGQSIHDHKNRLAIRLYQKHYESLCNEKQMKIDAISNVQIIKEKNNEAIIIIPQLNHY